MDLAHVVVDARDFQPIALRIDHAPPGEVINRGAPEHGLLAARIHGDIAAHARGIRGCGIDRKHQTRRIGGIGHAACHHTGATENGGHRILHPWQGHTLDRTKGF